MRSGVWLAEVRARASVCGTKRVGRHQQCRSPARTRYLLLLLLLLCCCCCCCYCSRTISADEYNRIKQVLVLLLRADMESGGALSQQDLLNRYLKQAADAHRVQTPEDLVRESRIVRQVVERLVSKDQILIAEEVPPPTNPGQEAQEAGGGDHDDGDDGDNDDGDDDGVEGGAEGREARQQAKKKKKRRKEKKQKERQQKKEALNRRILSVHPNFTLDAASFRPDRD